LPSLAEMREKLRAGMTRGEFFLVLMEYRSFSDDTAAMHYAEELIGDFEKVTVLEGVRIVGVVWHPSVRPRG